MGTFRKEPFPEQADFINALICQEIPVGVALFLSRWQLYSVPTGVFLAAEDRSAVFQVCQGGHGQVTINVYI